MEKGKSKKQKEMLAQQNQTDEHKPNMKQKQKRHKTATKQQQHKSNTTARQEQSHGK